MTRIYENLDAQRTKAKMMYDLHSAPVQFQKC